MHQLRLAAHLSRWMQDRTLDLGQLTAGRVDEFLVERRRTHTNRYSHRSLRPLLEFLNELGVLPAEAPAAPTPIELVVAGFERYQVNERGLLPRTAAAQASRVHRFLNRYCPPGGLADLSAAMTHHVECIAILRPMGDAAASVGEDR